MPVEREHFTVLGSSVLIYITAGKLEPDISHYHGLVIGSRSLVIRKYILLKVSSAALIIATKIRKCFKKWGLFVKKKFVSKQKIQKLRSPLFPHIS